MIPSGVSASALTLTMGSLYSYDLLHIWGGRSSAGRALDCGSSGRGFKSHRSPSCNQGLTWLSCLRFSSLLGKLMRLCPAHSLRRRSLSAYALARDAYSAPGLVVLRIFWSHILKAWTRLLGRSAIASLHHHGSLEYDPFLLPERLERTLLPTRCPIRMRMVAIFHESTGQPSLVQDCIR